MPAFICLSTKRKNMAENRHSGRPGSIERSIPALTALPRPVLSRAESLPAGSHTRLHAHDWAQFSYALSGVLEVRTVQASFMAPPQRAIWVPAGVEHVVTTSTPTEMRSLYISESALQMVPPTCRVLTVTPLLRELIVALSRFPVEYDEAGAAGRLVAVLFDELQGLEELELNLPLPRDRRLQQLCAGLQTHPDDRRTLDEWGGVLGLSARSLARLFQQETGMSFGQWRLRLRLLLALGALEQGESVTRVALDSGYESTSAFIAAFRDVFGVTPRTMFPFSR